MLLNVWCRLGETQVLQQLFNENLCTDYFSLSLFLSFLLHGCMCLTVSIIPCYSQRLSRLTERKINLEEEFWASR